MVVSADIFRVCNFNSKSLAFLCKSKMDLWAPGSLEHSSCYRQPPGLFIWAHFHVVGFGCHVDALAETSGGCQGILLGPSQIELNWINSEPERPSWL